MNGREPIDPGLVHAREEIAESVRSRAGDGIEPEGKTERRPASAPFGFTQEQRFLLMRGISPRISFPVKDAPALEPGTIVRLSSQVEIEITGSARTRKGEIVAEYVLRDRRPTLLRRTPQVHMPQSDSEGYVPADSSGDIEVARLDSSYTRSGHGAISDAGEAVAEFDQNLISAQARTRWAERKATDRAEEQARDDARRLSAQIRDILLMQARNGIDSTPFLADLQRLAGAQHEQQEAA